LFGEGEEVAVVRTCGEVAVADRISVPFIEVIWMGSASL
jgi:hypothetical protein